MKEYFDTIETQLICDITSIKSDLIEIKETILFLSSNDLISQKQVDEFVKKAYNLRQMLIGLNAIPFIQLCKRSGLFQLKYSLSQICYN